MKGGWMLYWKFKVIFDFFKKKFGNGMFVLFCFSLLLCICFLFNFDSQCEYLMMKYILIQQIYRVMQKCMLYQFDNISKFNYVVLQDVGEVCSYLFIFCDCFGSVFLVFRFQIFF